MSSLLVEADVSESNIEMIRLNQDCEITLDAYPEKSYAAYVFKIVPTADRSKATVLVKVGFKNYDSRVLPEMSAKVSFFTNPIDTSVINQKPILVIPSSSVRSEDGKSYIFTISDDKAVKNEIITGQKLGSYVEVISGLQAGQKVISDLNEKIKDGVEVKLDK